MTHIAAPEDEARILAHPSVVAVAQALEDQQVLGHIRVLPDSARTAAQAAALLGVEVGQIANSLVFRATEADGSSAPLLVMSSGAHKVDTTKVADLLELPTLERADADFVRAATGFVIGGVAPVGHPSFIRTVVDVSLARFETIWAAGGHHRTVFSTSYEELLRITAGQALEVT